MIFLKHYELRALTFATLSSGLTDSTGTAMSSTMYEASTTAPTITTPLPASSASSYYDAPLIYSTSTYTNSPSPSFSPGATSAADGSSRSLQKKYSANGTVILIVGTIGAVIPILAIVSWLYFTRSYGPQNKIKDIEILESEITMHTRASATVDPFSLRTPFIPKTVASEAEAVPPLPIQKVLSNLHFVIEFDGVPCSHRTLFHALHVIQFASAVTP